MAHCEWKALKSSHQTERNELDAILNRSSIALSSTKDCKIDDNFERAEQISAWVFS